MTHMFTKGLMVAVLLVGAGARQAASQEQIADLEYRPVIAAPAYELAGPRVLLDEAHNSVQTTGGRYAGFAALARADGYTVSAGLGALDVAEALCGVDILVISNPGGGEASSSAFTAKEIAAVDHWVREGGALLLAVDHAPHGDAAEALAAAFGVRLGKGYAYQPTRSGLTANLDFPQPALGDHPILIGRGPDETITRVRTFTGQSIDGPPGSTILLAMSMEAREAPDAETLSRIRHAIEEGRMDEAERLSRPALPAQGVAFTHGRGRVVVLGEAALLTAQRVRFDDGRPDLRFGFQTEGHDDQQFALNILHWLSKLLP